MSMTSSFLVLFFLFSCIVPSSCPAPTPPPLSYAPGYLQRIPITDLSWGIGMWGENNEGQGYDHISGSLRGPLSSYNLNPLNRREVQDRVVRSREVLGPRRPIFSGPPRRWIHIHMVGKSPDVKATLAIAPDDLYLFGFKNKTGDWNTLQEFSYLPDCTELPFGYQYFHYGESQDFHLVPLGKQSALEALQILSDYNPSTTNVEDAKSAVLKFILMVSEGSRFKELNRRLVEQWGRRQDIFLLENETKYLLAWSKLSQALLTWKWSQERRWDGTPFATEFKYFGVQSAWQALDVVRYILRPTPK